jgi:DNA-binding CsgD family transcriptional regulator
MPNAPALPWIKINDFLLEVCTAKTREEFDALVCAHISDLIPHDFPIFCVSSPRDDLQRLAAGAAPNKLIDPTIIALAGEPDTVAEWNQYYRFRLPITDGYFATSVVSDFRPYSHTEFVTDYVRPRGIDLCLGGWFRRYTVVVPRRRPARLFSVTEIAISRTIAPHLENYYNALTLAAVAKEESRVHSMRVNAARLGLTEREQEIAVLLSERLTMPEIAEKLSISRRTVESHAEHIYGKLGIRKKQELADNLLGSHSNCADFQPISVHLHKDQNKHQSK